MLLPVAIVGAMSGMPLVVAVVGLVLLCLLVSRVLVVSADTEWRQITLPPRHRRCFAGLFKTVMRGRSCRQSRLLFEAIRNSRLFSWKLFIEVFLLNRTQRRLELSLASVENELNRTLRESKVVRLRCFPPIGGYASLLLPELPTTVVVGLGSWIRVVPIFRGSVAGHELIHVVQHVCHGIFDQEWSETGLSRRSAVYYEMHAQFLGSPLCLSVTSAFVLSLIIPAIAEFANFPN